MRHYLGIYLEGQERAYERMPEPSAHTYYITHSVTTQNILSTEGYGNKWLPEHKFAYIKLRISLFADYVQTQLQELKFVHSTDSSGRTTTYFNSLYSNIGGGTRWHSWLRHFATCRKVAGSIPDEVIGFFS
jgi:hypothetical protein